MPIYENKKNIVCENCKNNTFTEQETFLINEETINSTLTNKKVFKKVILGKKICCAKCGAILTNINPAEIIE